MHINPSQNNAPVNDMQSMRGSVLGQVRYKDVETHVSHPTQKFLVKSTIVINLTSLLAMFVVFRLQDMFPPHDMPFMNAIGWYFFFGAIYGFLAAFFFKFAVFTENRAVAEALTHNRRYEWHSSYDTKNMTAEDLKKIPDAPKPAAASAPPVGAGSNYFKITGFLILAGYIACALGAWAFFGDFLASE